MPDLALIAALLAPLTVHLAEQAVIEVDAANIMLADVGVVTGGTADARQQAEALVIARLPQGRSRIALSRPLLSDLVRRRMGVQIASGEGILIIQRRIQRRGVEPRTATHACWAAAEDIVAGATLLREQVEEAPCEGLPLAALRRDRSSGTLRALGDIAAGTPVGPIAIEHLASAESGASITLTSRSGPVAVSRPVRALQPARPGHAVFVRDADGAVLSVRLDAPGDPRP